MTKREYYKAALKIAEDNLAYAEEAEKCDCPCHKYSSLPIEHQQSCCIKFSEETILKLKENVEIFKKKLRIND